MSLLLLLNNSTASTTTRSGSFVADSVLKKTVSATFSANAVIKATQSGSFTADAVIKRTWEASSYDATVQLLGPVGLWEFNDNVNGTVGPNGTLNNTTGGALPSYLNGIITNQSTSNDSLWWGSGTGQEVVFARSSGASAYDITFRPNSGRSLSFVWWQQAFSYNTFDRYLIAVGQDDSWDIKRIATGSLFTATIRTTSGTITVSMAQVPLNAAHQGVLTWDANGDGYARFYVDGSLVATSSTASTGTLLGGDGIVGTSAAIGNKPGLTTSGQWRDGLDDIAIFPRALNAEEIAFLYELGSKKLHTTADARLLRVESGSFTADAYITTGVTTVSGSFTANSVIKAPVSTTFTADSVIKGTISSTFTSNAVLKSTTAVTFAADAWIKGITNVTFTANAVIKGTISQTFTANAALRVTVAGSFTADSVLLRTTAASYVADAVVLRTESATFSADAALAALPTNPIWTTPADVVDITQTQAFAFLPQTSTSDQHYQMQFDRVNTFDSGELITYDSSVSNTNWEYYKAAAWIALPSTGLPAADSPSEVRLTVTFPAKGRWYRRVRGTV